VQDPVLGRPRSRALSETADEEEVELEERGYVDLERSSGGHEDGTGTGDGRGARKLSKMERDEAQGRVVDVVLSDMSAPWEQTAGFYKKSLSDPYFRMMNTSGVAFRDHAGSMVSAPLPLSPGTMRIDRRPTTHRTSAWPP
jgi:21S rRNA (uridine2791-2'-O)-methyltransferase